MEEGTPDAEKWQELKQMQADKTPVKVKIKEAVKAGVVAYVDEIRAFIPASHLSLEYVEKLEDWVGQNGGSLHHHGGAGKQAPGAFRPGTVKGTPGRRTQTENGCL